MGLLTELAASPAVAGDVKKVQQMLTPSWKLSIISKALLTMSLQDNSTLSAHPGHCTATADQRCCAALVTAARG